jgi:hypothetical protein
MIQLNNATVCNPISSYRKFNGMKTKKLALFGFLVFAVFVIGCKKDANDERPVFTLKQADSISAEEYKIYSVVMKELFSAFVIVLEQQTDSSIDLTKESYYLSTLEDDNPDIDSCLVNNYELQNDSSYCFDNNFDSVGMQVVLITSTEIQYIFSGNDINKNWDEFYKTYENSSGIVSFSRIGFNENHTQSVLEIGVQYASLGGEGCIIYLEKIKESWIIKDRTLTWISK